MASVTTRVCDACGGPVTEHPRRFVFGGVLASVNGAMLEAQRTDLDACSPTCLHTMLDAMIHEVMPQQTANVGA